MIFLTRFVVLGLVLATAARAAAPDPKELLAAAEKTRTRLAAEPARWVVRCQLTQEEAIVMRVEHDGGRRATVFVHEKEDRQVPVATLVQEDDAWFLQESGRWHKYRPYEATLHFPGAYFFNAFTDLRVADTSELTSDRFHSREGTRLTYRVTISGQERRVLEQAVAMFERLKAEDPPKPLGADMVAEVEMARKLLAEGTPLRVDETTGLIIQTKIQQITMTVEGFEWLKAPAESAFAHPANGWEDHTQPWTEPEQWIAVLRDPLATRGAASASLALDGYLVHARTGELRRVPFNGAASVPLCFLVNHRELLVTGVDPLSGTQLVKVNLETGENTPLTDGRAFEGLIAAGELSPDGREVALLQSFNGRAGMMDFQFRLLDLASGRISDFGPSGRWGAPFAWLPDGSGLVLKRYLPTKTLRAIEERVICRMNRDGTMKDIVAGDMPQVLGKTRRIVYETDRTWYTCNFDGSDVKPLAAGLPRVGFPTISPDEEQIAFMRFADGSLPVLTVFEMGQSIGRQVTKAPGAFGSPKWR